MKNIVIVDIDSERKPQVAVRRADLEGTTLTTKREDNILLDMATLCEGLCTLIHSANKAGIRKDYESLQEIIKHLENGFVDPSYTTYITESRIKKENK